MVDPGSKTLEFCCVLIGSYSMTSHVYIAAICENTPLWLLIGRISHVSAISHLIGQNSFFV